MGLRAKVERMCDVTPMPGRIAIYTSGCPKNQNRCCHRSGDPPSCGMSLSLTTRPPGMKKLLPPTRSSSSRIPPRQQYGKRQQREDRGGKPGPHGEGHPHERHAARPQIDCGTEKVE